MTTAPIGAITSRATSPSTFRVPTAIHANATTLPWIRRVLGGEARRLSACLAIKVANRSDLATVRGEVGSLVIAQEIRSAVHLAPLPIRGRGSLTKSVQRRRSKELQKSSGELLELFEVLLKIVGDSVDRLLRWGDRG